MVMCTIANRVDVGSNPILTSSRKKEGKGWRKKKEYTVIIESKDEKEKRRIGSRRYIGKGIQETNGSSSTRRQRTGLYVA